MLVNVMITRRNDLAVKCVKVNGSTKVFKGEGVFTSTLECIIDTLKVIPTNDVKSDNTYHIYLPDALIGFTSGSINSYIKNGCTGSGSKLTSKELVLFEEALIMYGQRVLNVSFKAIKYINTKKDTELTKLKQYCIEALNTAIKEQDNSVGSNNTTVNADVNAELRQKLSEQMLVLVSEGKFVEAQALSAMIANLNNTSTPAINKQECNNANVVDVNNTSEEDLDAMIQRDVKELGLDTSIGKVNTEDFIPANIEAEGIVF